MTLNNRLSQTESLDREFDGVRRRFALHVVCDLINLKNAAVLEIRSTRSPIIY